MKKIVQQSKKFFIKETKKLKEPYRTWYVLHAKYVGLAATDIDPKLDKNLLQIIGWLHDIAKIKKDKNHQIESAIIAKNFLKNKLDKDKINIILDAITNHGRNGKPSTQEGKVIQSADKLATFYPPMQKYVLKVGGKEELKKVLSEHYLGIKLKKAKQLAKKLMI